MKIITSSLTSLIIKFQGLEKAFSLHSHILIPIKSIVLIEYFDHFQEDSQKKWRLGGVSISNVLHAGRFYDGSNLDFLYLKDPLGSVASIEAPNVLCIETRDFLFRRLLISATPNKAGEILDWWKITDK